MATGSFHQARTTKHKNLRRIALFEPERISKDLEQSPTLGPPATFIPMDNPEKRINGGVKKAAEFFSEGVYVEEDPADRGNTSP